jgi:hypothetical protein
MSQSIKVLVIRSKPLVIEQVAESDYAGNPACNALREKPVTSMLFNSTMAKIITDKGIANIFVDTIRAMMNALPGDVQTFFVKSLREYLTPKGKGGTKRVRS